MTVTETQYKNAKKKINIWQEKSVHVHYNYHYIL